MCKPRSAPRGIVRQRLIDNLRDAVVKASRIDGIEVRPRPRCVADSQTEFRIQVLQREPVGQEYDCLSSHQARARVRQRGLR